MSGTDLKGKSLSGEFCKILLLKMTFLQDWFPAAESVNETDQRIQQHSFRYRAVLEYTL